MAVVSGFAHAFTTPVANDTSAAADCAIDRVELPAFLAALGECESDYADVHFVKNATWNGTSWQYDSADLLPSTVNAAGTWAYVDWASLASGEDEMYVLFGNPTATAPTAAAYVTAKRETDGIIVNLDKYGLATGVPAPLFDLTCGRSNSDNTAPQTSGSGTWYDETANNRDFTPSGAAYQSDGALVFDGTNDYAQSANYSSNFANGFACDFWCKPYKQGGAGAYNQPILHKAYTSHAAPYYQQHVALRGIAGGTPSIDAYALNFHIVADGTRYEVNTVGAIFTEATLTHTVVTCSTAGALRIYVNGSLYTGNISINGAAAVAYTTALWSGTKTLTGYNTPFELAAYTNLHGSGADYHTQTTVYAARVYDAALDSDDAAALYAMGGGTYAVSAMTMDANYRQEGTATRTVYASGSAHVESTYINSAATTTYYGAAASHQVGFKNAGSEKYRYLVNHQSEVFPLGTLSAAKLWLYVESLTGSGVMRLYRFKSTTEDAGTHNYIDTLKCHWTCQDVRQRPTWNTRVYGEQFQADRTWKTAGAMHADEIDTTEYVEFTLTTGWCSVDIPTQWVDDAYSLTHFGNGYLITAAAESGSDNYATITSYTQTNCPTFEFAYSEIALNQFGQKKTSAPDTYCYAQFSSHNRFSVQNRGFVVRAWINASNLWSIAYVASSGRMFRCVKDTFYSGERISENGGYGIKFDPSTERYVILAGNATLAGRVGWSAPNDPTTWTYQDTTNLLYKGAFVVHNDKLHIYTMDATYRLVKFSWTRGATAAPPTVWHNAAISGTLCTLTNDIDASQTTFALTGATTAYRVPFMAYIGYEMMVCTDITAGVATVVRGAYESNAVTHSAGATFYFDHQSLAYATAELDLDTNAVHGAYVCQSNSGTDVVPSPARMGYNHVYEFHHLLADADTVCRDAAGNAVTLPMTQLTEMRISTQAACFMSGAVYTNGKFHVLLVELTDYVNHSGTNNNMWMNNSNMSLKVATLDVAAGTWSYAEPADMTSTAMLASGSAGNAIAVGLEKGTHIKVLAERLTSGTWGTQQELGDYTGIPDAKGVYLWQNSVAEKANAAGYNIATAMHQAQGGPIFMDAVLTIQIIPGLESVLNVVSDAASLSQLHVIGGVESVLIPVSDSGGLTQLILEWMPVNPTASAWTEVSASASGWTAV